MKSDQDHRQTSFETTISMLILKLIKSEKLTLIESRVQIDI